MRIAPSVAVALACLAAAACGKSEEPAAKPPTSKLATLSYTVMEKGTSGYPGKSCPVHDKELASLGKPPYVIAYGNYEVQFCSKDCLEEFADDPETYVLKVHPKAMFHK